MCICCPGVLGPHTGVLGDGGVCSRVPSRSSMTIPVRRPATFLVRPLLKVCKGSRSGRAQTHTHIFFVHPLSIIQTSDDSFKHSWTS